MTPDQLTNLRRLLAGGDTLAGSHELQSAAVNALPELLDAVEQLHSRLQREAAMTTRYANEAGALEGQVKELSETLEANLWWYQKAPPHMNFQQFKARADELGELTRAALAKGGA